MHLDPLFLSRLQWAWVIAWHILLPAFTVGLASFIAMLEGLHLITGREIYFRISLFWTKIFAVSFGMGVVSGIIMPFQFGTNWSRFSDAAANVISPMLAYEDLMAFFLEASFLGILLFGRNLVPRWAHFFAACMVAIGTLFSTFWILSVNSWMQTPAGYEIKDGRFFPTDWLAIIFSPSFPYRLAHTVSGFYVTTAFVVLGVGAYLVRTTRFPDESRLMVKMALSFLILFVPLQIFLGDLHGLNTRQYQPAKLAAIEGDWDTASPTPLTAVRHPEPGRGTQRLCDRDPLSGQPRAHPHAARRDQGPEGFSGRPASARMAGVLRLPHHGRHRPPDARDRAGRVLSVVQEDGSSRRPGSCGSAGAWRRSASWPCWPAGPRRRSAASPGPSTACSARPIRSAPR